MSELSTGSRTGLYRPSWAALALLALAIAAGGCRQEIDVDMPAGTLSDYELRLGVYELANELNMTVAKTNETYASLRGPADNVVIFAGSTGSVYVNGARIRQADNITASGGIVQVPRSLIPDIRRAMSRAPVEAPPWRRPAPEPETPGPIRGLVMLDAGHGGRDPGAQARLRSNGPMIDEKAINLQMVRKIASQLKRQGAEVTLTRWRDRTVELDDRVAMANRQKAKLFVSLHANSETSRRARGFQLYIAEVAGTEAQDAAKRIAASLKASGFESHGDAVRTDHDRALRVLRRTREAAVLIEIGFMSNRTDLAKIVNSRYQDRLARAIADGIAEHLRNR
jgi:N-acetylmuramoyl-L-alanine amidase